MREARCSQYVDIGKPSDKAGGAPERGAGAPSSGMRPRRRAIGTRINPARLARCGVAPTPTGAGTAPPSACRPGRNPEGRGDLGASCCRSPLQYRHIAAGDPPKPASHIASVAHVPIYEIGSSISRRGAATAPPTAFWIIPRAESRATRRYVAASLPAMRRAPAARDRRCSARRRRGCSSASGAAARPVPRPRCPPGPSTP